MLIFGHKVTQPEFAQLDNENFIKSCIKYGEIYTYFSILIPH